MKEFGNVEIIQNEGGEGNKNFLTKTDRFKLLGDNHLNESFFNYCVTSFLNIPDNCMRFHTKFNSFDLGKPPLFGNITTTTFTDHGNSVVLEDPKFHMAILPADSILKNDENIYFQLLERLTIFSKYLLLQQHKDKVPVKKCIVIPIFSSIGHWVLLWCDINDLTKKIYLRVIDPLYKKGSKKQKNNEIIEPPLPFYVFSKITEFFKKLFPTFICEMPLKKIHWIIQIPKSNSSLICTIANLEILISKYSTNQENKYYCFDDMITMNKENDRRFRNHIFKSSSIIDKHRLPIQMKHDRLIVTSQNYKFYRYSFVPTTYNSCGGIDYYYSKDILNELKRTAGSNGLSSSSSSQVTRKRKSQIISLDKNKIKKRTY